MKLPAVGRHEAHDRTAHDVAVDDRRAERERHAMAVAGARRIHRFDVDDVGARDLALMSRAAAVIARREHDTAARAIDVARCRPACVASTPTTRPPLLDDALDGGVQPDVDAELAAVAREVIRERFRVRHHVVHARIAVMLLGHRADEHHAEPHQPLEHVGGVVDEDAAQREVVARRERPCVRGEVLEVLLRAVLYPGALLVRRVGRGHRADRPRRRAAGVRVLLEQDDAPAQRAPLPMPRRVPSRRRRRR